MGPGRGGGDEPLRTFKKKATLMTMSDKKKFFKYLDTITLKNEDYFNWDRKKAGKPYRVVKTVLNSKEACLKKC